MSEERIAQLVVEYLLIAAGGMIDDKKTDQKADTGGGGSKGGKGGSDVPVLSDIFKQFETKLFAVLAPAALMATILTSATSGLSTFISVVKMIGNTLGMVLFPVIALAAAVLMTFNDMLLSVLMPNLEEWATAVITGGLDAIDTFGRAVVDFAQQIAGMGNAVRSTEAALYKFVGTMLVASGQMLTAFNNLLRDSSKGMIGLPQEFKAIAKNNMRMGKSMYDIGERKDNQSGEVGEWESIATKLGTGIADKLPGFKQGVVGNLGKFLDQVKFENAPKSQQMGLAQANLNAQMASFQMSPFEREQLAKMQQMIEIMYQVYRKVAPPTTS